MLSPTNHRILTTSAIVVITIFILLTLYNLRDTRTTSLNSLVSLRGDKEDTARAPTYDVTKSIFSLLRTPGNEQDAVKIPAHDASLLTTAATSAVDVPMPSATAARDVPRRAFVTFLEADTGTNHGDQARGTTPDDEDAYFVGV